MTIDEIDNELFYPMYVSWASNAGGQPAPFNLLPERGFLVRDVEDRPVACAWCGLVMGIGMYHVLFLTTDESRSVILRARAIEFLLDGIHEIMETQNYSHGMITSSTKSLTGLLRLLKWKTIDENVTILMNY